MFVASNGWREKFVERHPEVRTKVSEVRLEINL